jgi:hypothetical protein
MNEKEAVALRSALNVLRGLLPTGAPSSLGADEPVHQFVRQRLVTDPLYSVTSEAVAEFYVENSKHGQFPALPRHVVLRRLGPAIFTVHGVRRTHNVVVDGKHRRGFNGLRFV